MLGKDFHLSEPMGGSKRGPFATCPDEKTRAVQNIRAILLERVRMRPHRPKLGTRLPDYLDEPSDRTKLSTIESDIRTQLVNNEKHVRFTLIEAQAGTLHNRVQGTSVRAIRVIILGVLTRTGEPIGTQITLPQT